MPSPHFWIYIYLPISDVFFKTEIYDKGDDFDFDIVNFPFLGMFLVRHPLVFIFLNLFDLLVYPVMLMALILVIRF